MSKVDCERCSREVEDARVCSLCGRDAERALGNVPTYVSELQVTLSRQHRLSAQSDGGRSAETPVPFHVRAGESLDVLRNVMVGWCKLYAEEAKADLPETTDEFATQCRVMAAFLKRRVEWFRHHDLGAEFVGEIVSAVGSIRHVIDSPTHRTAFTVGPCPEVFEEGACSGVVWAYIPASEDDEARMECRTCGTKWETWQWLRAGKRILERRDTLAVLDSGEGA